MLYGRIVEASLRIEHRHGDGSVGVFEPTPHDAADHDPERDWAAGQIIYACASCDEQIRVSTDDGPGKAAAERG